MVVMVAEADALEGLEADSLEGLEAELASSFF